MFKSLKDVNTLGRFTITSFPSDRSQMYGLYSKYNGHQHVIKKQKDTAMNNETADTNL